MTTSNREEILAGLAKLSKREREVLELRCQGYKYEDIGKELLMGIPTVKQNMQRIYIKTGIDREDPPVRTKKLYQDICPLLALLEDIEPSPEIEEDEVIPDRVVEMVDEDEEDSHDKHASPTPEPAEEPSRPFRPLRWLLGGAILSCIGLALILFGINYFFGPFSFGQPAAQPNPDVGLTEAALALTQTAIADQIFPTEIPFTQTEVPEPAVLIVTDTIQPTSTDTPLPKATPTLSISLPFEDTFDLRARDEWTPITGTWRVIDGHLTADTGFEWQITYIGDENWQNYKIEVTTFSEDFVYPIRVILRASNKGYIAFEYNKSDIEWILVNNGVETVLLEVTMRFDWNRTYKITVIADEDIFTAMVDGIQISQIQDTTFQKGKVGLGFKSYYLTWFDDFQVAPLR